MADGRAQRIARWTVAATVTAALACSAARHTATAPAPGKRTTTARGGDVVRRFPTTGRGVGDATIRVALASAAAAPRVGADGDWRLTTPEGDLLARGTASEGGWRVERDGARIRAVRPDGVPTLWQEGAIVVRPIGDAILRYGTRRYRGELVLSPGTDSGIVVVNRLPIDDYLAGVVPLELGDRPARDSAAVQAQAVAARSYAASHLSDAGRWDVGAGVTDQVYGGVEAERPVATAAVEATRGLVLRYGGRIANAPYHATCGGATASASEIWRTAPEPYLVSVSDRIPGSDRYWCDIAPRFRWTRTFDGAQLDAAIRRYLGQYAALPGRDPGAVRTIEVDDHTPSGRVATLRISTDRGSFLVRGNDARSVLRVPGGEILNSSYFSVAEATTGPNGAITKLVLRGTGYGHGVGMCQWGAIGRARAGQSFREILEAYYPGTTVE